MNHSNDADEIAAGKVSIRDHIWQYEAEADMAPKVRARRAAGGMSGEPIVKRLESRRGDVASGLLREVVDDRGYVSLRDRRDDDPRHQVFKDPRRAAICAVWFSSETNSPRSSAAKPSSM